MTDPVVQVENTDQNNDIFGWSADIFDNPNMFSATNDTPVTPQTTEDISDFSFNFDNLQAGEHVPAQEASAVTPPIPEVISEPVIIEPTPEPEPTPTPAPEPMIIDQVIEPKKVPEPRPPMQKPTVIEPQIKAGVTVNPWKQQVKKPEQIVKPDQRESRGQTPPQVRPQMQKSTPIEPQMKPGVSVNPFKPQVKQQVPPNKPTVEQVKPVQEVKIPEIVMETQPQNASGSDIKKKLDELIQITQKNYTVAKKNTAEFLEVFGANNDKVSILYKFSLEDGNVFIKKIDTDKTSGEDVVNDLWFVFNEENTSVEILLDGVLFFDEVEHLQDDPKKKMQVNEKLNKFIFLLGEHFKKTEKEMKEKEEAENERRRLQDIFRNF